VVDPENSAFFDGWANDDPSHTTGRASRIEGIGRPRVEPSFMPSIVDSMIAVPDAASIAAARWCSAVTGLLVGGSTGTALWGALKLVARMRAAERSGSVVTLLCDGGERYTHTYYDDGWLAAQGIDIAPYLATLEKFADSGDWVEPSTQPVR
jgi:cysteine synthase A